MVDVLKEAKHEYFHHEENDHLNGDQVVVLEYSHQENAKALKLGSTDRAGVYLPETPTQIAHSILGLRDILYRPIFSCFLVKELGYEKK